VNEIVRILQGLQYGSTTGEGVPTGWMPGMSGISMDIANAGKI
jgi:NADH-dependent peroxiredoxin subunit C